ncbi:putative toxin-antitoxin system toxin component, PIN family [Frateuria sp. GZRe14]|uniref:PIN domain-containing protein n=1 Tax=Frateuria sp. GZRe14 TaxID=3351534 RepID=UPI003EDC62EC
MAGSPPRVVLDTNVCLDLFVFADPRCAGLAAALQGGAIEAVTVAACEDEWRMVLGYPQLALEEAVRAHAIAAFDALVRRLPEARMATVRLPRCADPDDQKFLELAACAGARWLLSRDRALLAWNRRCLREHGFAIVTPQAWRASYPEAPASAV